VVVFGVSGSELSSLIAQEMITATNKPRRRERSKDQKSSHLCEIG
jgi:hypothetical protein